MTAAELRERTGAADAGRDDKRILKYLLDICAYMLESGAEGRRVEDALYRFCHSYGFVHADAWVIYSNIQVTVETEEGDIFTQIRHIPTASANYDRLDYLNNLARRVCRETPDADRLIEMIEEVLNRKPQAPWVEYLGGMLGGTGFAVFFNCDVQDAIVAMFASALVVFIGRRLGKVESNTLIFNFIEALLVEVFIILAVALGFAHHVGNITVGVVMLIVSALALTNGITDLMHKDTLSGILNIANSLLGAIGIACGVAVALYLFKGVI